MRPCCQHRLDLEQIIGLSHNVAPLCKYSHLGRTTARAHVPRSVRTLLAPAAAAQPAPHLLVASLHGSWSLEKLVLLLDTSHPRPCAPICIRLVEVATKQALSLSESKLYASASVALMRQLAQFCDKHDICLQGEPHSHLAEAFANAVDWHARNRCGAFTSLVEARDLLLCAGAFDLTGASPSATPCPSTSLSRLLQTAILQHNVWSDTPLVQLTTVATDVLGVHPQFDNLRAHLLDVWLQGSSKRMSPAPAIFVVDLLSAYSRVASSQPSLDQLPRGGGGAAVMCATHLAGCLAHLMAPQRLQELDDSRLLLLPSLMCTLAPCVGNGALMSAEVDVWATELEREVDRRERLGRVAPAWLRHVFRDFIDELQVYHVPR